MTDPTLDEKIAAVRDAIYSTEDAPDDSTWRSDDWFAAMHAVLADLEASRPTPGPDNPKDTERLTRYIIRQDEISRDEIAHLTQERDAATRRAEALEAEVVAAALTMLREPSEDNLRIAALAICKSRTCEGMYCCQWPANLGRLNCNAKAGAYDHAARAALSAAADAMEKK